MSAKTSTHTNPAQRKDTHMSTTPTEDGAAFIPTLQTEYLTEIGILIEQDMEDAEFFNMLPSGEDSIAAYLDVIQEEASERLAADMIEEIEEWIKEVSV